MLLLDLAPELVYGIIAQIHDQGDLHAFSLVCKATSALCQPDLYRRPQIGGSEAFDNRRIRLLLRSLLRNHALAKDVSSLHLDLGGQSSGSLSIDDLTIAMKGAAEINFLLGMPFSWHRARVEKHWESQLQLGDTAAEAILLLSLLPSLEQLVIVASSTESARIDHYQSLLLDSRYGLRSLRALGIDGSFAHGAWMLALPKLKFFCPSRAPGIVCSDHLEREHVAHISPSLDIVNIQSSHLTAGAVEKLLQDAQGLTQFTYFPDDHTENSALPKDIALALEKHKESLVTLQLDFGVYSGGLHFYPPQLYGALNEYSRLRLLYIEWASLAGSHSSPATADLVDISSVLPQSLAVLYLQTVPPEAVDTLVAFASKCASTLPHLWYVAVNLDEDIEPAQARQIADAFKKAKIGFTMGLCRDVEGKEYDSFMRQIPDRVRHVDYQVWCLDGNPGGSTGCVAHSGDGEIGE